MEETAERLNSKPEGTNLRDYDCASLHFSFSSVPLTETNVGGNVRLADSQ